MPTRLLLYAFLLLIIPNLSAQTDYSWWNQTHNWDGVSHWSNYLTFSPAYMGPNALPVPRLLNGRVGSRAWLEAKAEAHSIPGDQTVNLFGKFYFPVVADIIALEFYGVPVEYFQHSDKVRDERAARDIDSRGFATGDFYFGTIVQLLKDKERFPDVVLSLNCRTASGGNLDNARYTDAPGYWFDLSFGKDIQIKENVLRFYGMGGFYVWQTNIGIYPQNDAVMFGAGSALNLGEWTIDAEVAGYLGYIGNGDKPIVIRSSIEKSLNQSGLRLGYRHGLNDFLYQTLALSYVRFWNR